MRLRISLNCDYIHHQNRDRNTLWLFRTDNRLVPPMSIRCLQRCPCSTFHLMPVVLKHTFGLLNERENSHPIDASNHKVVVADRGRAVYWRLQTGNIEEQYLIVTLRITRCFCSRFVAAANVSLSRYDHGPGHSYSTANLYKHTSKRVGILSMM